MPDPTHPALWGAPLVGVLLAALCLWRAYVCAYRARLVDNLPTCKTTGVFIGLVELEGRARSNRPVTSYLAEAHCVHYEWSIDEHWSRTVTETYTDSKGRSRTRTRTESGWKTVDKGGESIDFFLEDDEGKVLVRPQGAKLELETIFSETCRRSDPLYYGKGPRRSVMHSDHRRRFTERGITLGRDLYVIGRASEREDVVAPQIAYEKDAKMFLISTRSQEAVRSSLGVGYWGWTIFGVLLVGGGFALGDALAHLPADSRWPNYLLACVVTGFVLVPLLWLLMAYNALVDLRHRVEAAWRQVDIQLQRRATLIPSLVTTVQAVARHEQDTQEALADLRSQAGATAPGESGANPHQVRQQVQIVVERYPELTADANFRQLQDELIATEQRIALARGYFNEIATHYNTRLETVPERYVAAMGSMKRRELIEAQAFERDAVEVDFTPAEPQGAESVPVGSGPVVSGPDDPDLDDAARDAHANDRGALDEGARGEPDRSPGDAPPA